MPTTLHPCCIYAFYVVYVVYVVSVTQGPLPESNPDLPLPVAAKQIYSRFHRLRSNKGRLEATTYNFVRQHAPYKFDALS